MAAYYNEFDPYAAQWLRNLIAAGHIAPGEVDERSICDVDSADIAGFTQCHFFAGIGVWSRALRLAGWPDDRPVWTGSCPCQPFSAAGRRGGFDDERHLWPELFRLIRERRPPVVFGEQVASKDGLQWLDLVQADLEGSGYASAAADLCAAGIGAPHIRQRLYWVADADDTGLEGGDGEHADSGRWKNETRHLGSRGAAVGLADAEHDGHHRQERSAPQSHSDQQVKRISDGDCAVGGLADAATQRRQHEPSFAGSDGTVDGEAGCGVRVGGDGDVDRLADADHRRCVEQHALLRPEEVGRLSGDLLETSGGSPTNGHWRDADWLYCRDGKWRPVEPGTFPLAHGATARVGRLRAYGNAIVPQVAQAFIEAFMECRP